MNNNNVNNKEYLMSDISLLQSGYRFVSSALSRIWSSSPPENLILQKLEKNLLLLIFNHLEGRDLVAAAGVCQKFRQFIPKSTLRVEILFIRIIKNEKQHPQSNSSIFGDMFYGYLHRTEAPIREPEASLLTEAKALCLMHGDMPRALRLANQCLDLPSKIRLLVAIGKKAEKVGNTELALRIFDRALEEATQLEATKKTKQVSVEGKEEAIEVPVSHYVNEELDPVAYVLSSLCVVNPETSLIVARGLKGHNRKLGAHETQKDIVLKKLFNYWVSRDLEKALKIVEEMKWKNNSYITILGYWDVKDEQGAFEIVRKIRSTFDRVRAISNFSQLLVPANVSRAFEIADQCEIYIDDIGLGEFNHNHHWKMQLHCDILKALAPHDPQQALKGLHPQLSDLNKLRTLSSIIPHLDLNSLKEVKKMAAQIEEDGWRIEEGIISGFYRALAIAYIPHDIVKTFNLVYKVSNQDRIDLINALVPVERNQALSLLETPDRLPFSLVIQTLAQHGEINKAMTLLYRFPVSIHFPTRMNDTFSLIDICAKYHPGEVPKLITEVGYLIDSIIKKEITECKVSYVSVQNLSFQLAPYDLERAIDIASKIDDKSLRLSTYKQIGELVFSKGL